MRHTGFLSFCSFSIVLFLLTLPAWPFDDPPARATLKGIDAVLVIIEPLDPQAKRDGLTRDQLQTDVEVRLRKAGIKVSSGVPIGSSEILSPLHLMVKALERSPSQRCVYAINLELLQDVALLRKPNATWLAPTWDHYYLGEVGADRFSRQVRDNVADLVDKFINAYLEQNPKQ
jgi:hypothetical protein